MPAILFAPWRLDYIKDVANGPASGANACFVCGAANSPERDEQNLVLLRGQSGLVMLNRYPYVNGSLLIAPYRHAADLSDMSEGERAEMMELLTRGQQLVAGAMNPQGFNAGINVGRAAGAGLPGHIHMHLVPRWNGDTNFMTVVGEVRVIPQALEQTYKQLHAEADRPAPRS